MSKRDAFWDSIPNTADGEIQWPDDPNERTAMVRDVFGAKVVGAMDAVIEEALAVADARRPEPGSHDYEREVAFRAIFEPLTDQQREAVRKVVKDAASGTLYWALVKLTNYPSGAVHVRVEPWGVDQAPLPECDVHDAFQELPTLYLDWIERFSDQVEPPSLEKGRWG